MDFIFNVAKGKLAYYNELPGANDALVVVPIESAGIEADDVLQEYDTLAALLAGSSNEQTTMGRKVLTAGVSNSRDAANNWTNLLAPTQITWVAAGGSAIAALVVCYDPDTTGGSDTDLIPLSKHTFAATPAGVDIVAQVAATGYARVK